MTNIFLLLILTLSLSMDAFSLAISLGTFLRNKKEQLIISLNVGLLHYIMPLIGCFFGKAIINILTIPSNYLVSICFFLIFLVELKEYFNKEEIAFSFSIISSFLFSITVSIDSFSSGISLYLLTDKIFFTPILFSISSFLFTYLGFFIGSYAIKKIGNIAKIIGIMAILFLSIVYFCK